MAYARSKNSFTEIPVIDIAPIRTGDGVEKVARAMCEASTSVGFFYISGHGVPQASIDKTLHAAREFFAHSPEHKNEVAVNALHRGYLGVGGARMESATRSDLKESFVYGREVGPDDPEARSGDRLTGPNQWPSDVPDFETAVYGLFEEMNRCARDVLSALAVGLELPVDFFGSYFTKPMARGSIIHYPPQPADLGEEQFGVGPHTDYGFLTLLWQDSVGGLEVLNRDGDWVMAPPIPGTFVVNVGDLLARWSNERFSSTQHRVVNRTGQERYSIPLFFDPNFDTVIDPRDANLPAGAEPLHQPVLAGHHVLARFNDAFRYRSSVPSGAPEAGAPATLEHEGMRS